MQTRVNGKQVTLEFELQEPRPSATGKTLVVYTTGGFIPVAGTEYKVNLTVVAPRKGR